MSREPFGRLDSVVWGTSSWLVGARGSAPKVASVTGLANQCWLSAGTQLLGGQFSSTWLLLMAGAGLSEHCGLRVVRHLYTVADFSQSKKQKLPGLPKVCTQISQRVPSTTFCQSEESQGQLESRRGEIDFHLLQQGHVAEKPREQQLWLLPSLEIPSSTEAVWGGGGTA